MTAIILAASDIADEPALITAAGTHGLSVLRRAIDAADLLAYAAADHAMPVVVSADFPRLTGDLVRRLLVDDRQVVGLAGDAADGARFAAWGVDSIVTHVGDADATMEALARSLGGGTAVPAPAQDPESGLFVVVWGPTGAPGRTTLAISLAESLAERGLRTCLVDADLMAPTMVAQLGVVDDAGGLTVACRHAEHGTLSERALTQCGRAIGERLVVLGGVSRADRWADIRERAVQAVWSQARTTFDAVVVDIGSCAPASEEPYAGTAILSQRRDVAARTAIAVADRVVVVGRSTMMGVVRLLNELPDLGASADVVVMTGESTQTRDIDRLLRLSGMSAPVVAVPRGAGSLEQAMRAGLLPRESASKRERRRLDDVVSVLLADRALLRVRAGRRRGRRP